MDNLSIRSLTYHACYPAGKLAMVPAKPTASKEDLSLAYSPGVAYPSREIQKNPDASYVYTMRGNTVAVITDGSAVLGLGNIGTLASIPVMEGKCMLLARFAGINGIPLAISSKNAEEFIQIVCSLKDNFGAINLEDIRAPQCFEIEETLQKKISVPVFHDDQHGTAIVVLAGLLNSLALAGKNLSSIEIVINGAGAAGIACAKLFIAAGVPVETIILVDSLGVVSKDRKVGMNQYKEEFAISTKKKTLEDALKGADVFIGVSKAGVLKPAMIKSMASKPIIFALANPEPEILPDDAYHAGAFVVATGRSDFPNQVNNAIAFPALFRGALDIRASRVTMGMKLAASRALGKLVNKDNIEKNGVLQIIPNVFDPQIAPTIALEVARAAVIDSVAQIPLPEANKYVQLVKKRIALVERLTV